MRDITYKSITFDIALIYIIESEFRFEYPECVRCSSCECDYTYWLLRNNPNAKTLCFVHGNHKTCLLM